MVPWMTLPPDDTGSYGNQTGTYADTSGCYNIVVTPRVMDAVRSVCEGYEEEQAKEEARLRSMKKSRSFWQNDVRRHEFRQPKWSMDKPRCR
jgi:hypothetical protein